MSIRRTSRTAIWVALAVQLAGLLFDVVWHALHPTFEAVTVREMVNHLSTVHLPIYLGALGVLVTTAWALVDQRRRRRRGIALPVAFMGPSSRSPVRPGTRTCICSSAHTGG
jgi:hypothetical protein